VNDLAQGDLSHAELGVKHGRSKQAIHQFSARNAAEISEVRAAMRGELQAQVADLWIADKKRRIAWRQKLAEDIDVHLEDEELDLKDRHHLTRNVDQLLRSAAEELGDLPARTVLQVQLPPTPMKNYGNTGCWFGDCGLDTCPSCTREANNVSPINGAQF
jgi:hypothetical protein